LYNSHVIVRHAILIITNKHL